MLGLAFNCIHVLEYADKFKNKLGLNWAKLSSNWD